MLITFIRHGETVGNKQKIVNGQTDDKLNELGMQQAKDCGLAMHGIEVDCVWSSDSSRTHETAQLICENANRNHKVCTDVRLRERSFGAYENGPNDIMTKDVLASGLLHYQFFESCAEIETSEQILQRRLGRFGDKIEGKGYEHVVIVTHGSLIRVVTGYLLGLSVDEFRSLFARVDNCAKVVINLEKKKIIKYNA